ncbi:hypothetical protein Cpin_5969 [Chitinophaga pinensis DSM 2588]|uniref:DUF2892 domain-containing protein n=1 Tax=Chitinophaga pinensis (strain ATCC 43595 / DSM 2588 / LMG 13176 / NBRC 15968 / NCIMB 11800 / UQM 2034) TaxID=485918 RepID=A0A979G9Y4_CHIPD|nr:hypothetical protein Cpin_5969 [Chitinophaga pinensis DSM 2588]
MFKYFKRPAKATIVKLVIGAYFTISGIIDQQWQIIVLGGLMVVFSLTVKGGCSSGTCEINYKYKR